MLEVAAMMEVAAMFIHVAPFFHQFRRRHRHCRRRHCRRPPPPLPPPPPPPPLPPPSPPDAPFSTPSFSRSSRVALLRTGLLAALSPYRRPLSDAMATNLTAGTPAAAPAVNGITTDAEAFTLKAGLAQMLKVRACV